MNRLTPENADPASAGGWDRVRARPTTLVALAAVAFVALVALAWNASGDAHLSWAEAVLLGGIEGVTEYLPVSSTGHLTVVQELLGLTDTADGERAADAYAVIIQAGAIAAVGGLYRHRIGAVLRSIRRGPGHEVGRTLGLALVAGFVPAGVAGFLLSDLIKDRLFGIWPTVAAWAVGGIVLLAWSKRERQGGRLLESIRVSDGAVIGVIQVLALWPGVSRSLVTILGAVLLGFTLVAAVEFSFLLGFVTLGAATVYEAVDSGQLVVDEFGIATPAIGFAAATASAAIAVVWLVRYLERHGLAAFGWYRIGLAAVVATLAVSTGL